MTSTNSQKFYEFFKQLDMISTDYKITFKKSPKFKSNIGAFLSLIVIAITIAIGLISFQPVLSYANPQTVISSLYSDSILLNFTKQEYPLMFIIADSFGRPLLDPDQYISLRPFSSYFEKNLDGSYSVKINQMNISKCSDFIIRQNFGKNWEQYYNFHNNQTINNSFCFPLNENKNSFFIKNAYGTNDSQLINFMFMFCTNTTTSNNCKSMETIMSTLKTYFIYVFLPDFYLDHSQKDPFNFRLYYRPLPISMIIGKINIFNYKSVTYNTDIGLVFPIVQSSSYVQLASRTLDFQGFSESEIFPNLFYQVMLTLDSQVSTLYTRSYTKIPQVLAEILGIFQSVGIGAFILNYYFEIKLRELEFMDSFMSFENFNKVRNSLKKNKTFTSDYNALAKGVHILTEKGLNKKHLRKKIIKSPIIRRKRKNTDQIAKSYETYNGNYIIFEEFERLKNIYSKLKFGNFYNIFCRNKLVTAKFVIAEKFYEEALDIKTLVDNMIEFQILRRNLKQTNIINSIKLI